MKYSKTFAQALEDVRKPKVVKEDKDHEVSMAVGQVKVMQERLGTIMSFLSSKTDDYNIEGWVQSYITSAEETLTTIADYLDKNPEVQNEEKLQEQEEEPVKKEQPKKDPEVLEKQISDLKSVRSCNLNCESAGRKQRIRVGAGGREGKRGGDEGMRQ